MLLKRLYYLETDQGARMVFLYLLFYFHFILCKYWSYSFSDGLKNSNQFLSFNVRINNKLIKNEYILTIFWEVFYVFQIPPKFCGAKAKI